MNKIKLHTYILLTFLFSLAGCNDSFLALSPVDKISDANYWKTPEDLKLYNNALYPTYVSGFGYDFADGTVAPYGINVSTIPYGDVITDNAAPNTYSRVTTNEYIAYLSGGSGSNGWNWANVRQLNFFLDNYSRVQGPAATINIYLGEIYFFKAMEYFQKVKTFGDVPWLNKALDTKSEELYAARTSREVVMDSVMNILNKAITFLPEKGKEEAGRVNKNAALFLKARIGLFEGTFRKYHNKGDGTKFLKACTEACEAIMAKNVYRLYTTNKPEEDYNTLFAQTQYSTNPEIILYKEYSSTLNMGAAFSRYYAQNLRHQHGATRDLVDEYLCADGLPISQSPLYQGKSTLTKELTDRDPRLRQTICDYNTYQLRAGVQGANNAPLPNIPGLSGNKCPTGYRVAKWFYNNPTDWDLVTLGQQACPIYRYAEVLLNYAEAKYELGEISQDVIDKTINVIRARVKMPALNMTKIPADEYLDNKILKYIGYKPAPILREIRRERRVEMAFENTRWDDLMRWKAGKFLEIPVEGFKFEQARFPTLKVDKDVFLSPEGYIKPYHQVLPNGRTWDDRQYLFPIPIEDLVLNPQLVQNPGWQAK